MKAVGQALKLRTGCYDEYKKRHDELWPELADVMRSHGVNMAIYRFEDTLFIYGTAPSEEAWEEIAAHPVTPQWNADMAEVLETDENGELIRHMLPQAFAFGDFDYGE
jgi:L-rhamnose mutarotase